MPPRSGIQLPSGAPVAPLGVSPDAPVVVDEEVALPRYRVATDVPFFDGQKLYGPGDELVHVGEPSTNLEPLNGRAKEMHGAVVEALERNPNVQSKPVGLVAYGGDPDQRKADAQDRRELEKRLEGIRNNG